MKYLTVILVLVTFLHQTFGEACDDALHPDTNLCKRWHVKGMCGEKNVRDFCQRSCNECDNEENDDDSSPQYVGCFHDATESELELMSSRHGVSVRSCVDSCGHKRFSYAGLRNGKYCMCGNDYGSHGEVLKRDGCSKRCGGREACGGSLENAIYKTSYNKNKRSYLENIEELVLGKEKKQQISRGSRPAKRKHLNIPKTKRTWNFMDWLRRYEDQSNMY